MAESDFFRSIAGRSIRAPAIPTKRELAMGSARRATCRSRSERRERRIVDRFAAELEKFAARIRPELVLVSAGFDSHRADPIGSLGLEVEDFAELTKIVRDRWRPSHAGGRMVSVLKAVTTRPCWPSASKRTCAD